MIPQIGSRCSGSHAPEGVKVLLSESGFTGFQNFQDDSHYVNPVNSLILKILIQTFLQFFHSLSSMEPEKNRLIIKTTPTSASTSVPVSPSFLPALAGRNAYHGAPAPFLTFVAGLRRLPACWSLLPAGFVAKGLHSRAMRAFRATPTGKNPAHLGIFFSGNRLSSTGFEYRRSGTTGIPIPEQAGTMNALGHVQPLKIRQEVKMLQIHFATGFVEI